MWGVYEQQIGEGELIFIERHVIPMQGKPHIKYMTCWCKPQRDVEDPMVVVHNEEN